MYPAECLFKGFLYPGRRRFRRRRIDGLNRLQSRPARGRDTGHRRCGGFGPAPLVDHMQLIKPSQGLVQGLGGFVRAVKPGGGGFGAGRRLPQVLSGGLCLAAQGGKKGADPLYPVGQLGNKVRQRREDGLGQRRERPSQLQFEIRELRAEFQQGRRTAARQLAPELLGRLFHDREQPHLLLFLEGQLFPAPPVGELFECIGGFQQGHIDVDAQVLDSLRTAEQAGPDALVDILHRPAGTGRNDRRRLYELLGVGGGGGCVGNKAGNQVTVSVAVFDGGGLRYPERGRGVLRPAHKPGFTGSHRAGEVIDLGFDLDRLDGQVRKLRRNLLDRQRNPGSYGGLLHPRKRGRDLPLRLDGLLLHPAYLPPCRRHLTVQPGCLGCDDDLQLFNCHGFSPPFSGYALPHTVPAVPS